MQIFTFEISHLPFKWRIQKSEQNTKNRHPSRRSGAKAMDSACCARSEDEAPVYTMLGPKTTCGLVIQCAVHEHNFAPMHQMQDSLSISWNFHVFRAISPLNMSPSPSNPEISNTEISVGSSLEKIETWKKRPRTCKEASYRSIRL